ncbi:MAG: GDP-L-fucose synthase [Proteobacteria bacterium]|nr:GDP-L-fucose synthase [Pseudomonadota bacterium]
MELDSKIYVAGHRGLVGTAFMRCLEGQGFTNVITRTHSDLDLTDQPAVRSFFENERPEYVFVAAAKVGGIHANNSYPAEFIRQNLAIQDNVIHQCWCTGIKRLLFLGSSCIYPRECPQPMKEAYLLTGPLEPTNRPYAVAKIAGIEMCWAYNRQYGTQYLTVMPTNLYGPGDNYDLQDSHVLPALIRKFHLARLAEQGDLEGIRKNETFYGPIPQDVKKALGLSADSLQLASSSPRVLLWGTGNARREFLYSDDMADACVSLMNLTDKGFKRFLSPLSPPLVNIGCGSDNTIRELSNPVKDIVGFTGEIVWDSDKPDGNPQKLLDTSLLASLGWEPTTKLTKGIKKAFQDYLEYQS